MRNRLSLAIVIVTIFLLGFEAYAVAVVRLRGKAVFPGNIGNFERIRNSLRDQPAKDTFAFAVVSNTVETGTFMQICDKLRGEPLSFLIILGDFVQTCTKANHDYFKSEYIKRCRLPFPVFFVPGDRDVLYDEMNDNMDEVTLPDFERVYGPANFSFEYGGCLFIGLCTLPAPYSNRDSMDFLASVLTTPRNDNKPVFVLTHMSPIAMEDFNADSFEGARDLAKLVDHYEVDYVISADGHGGAGTKQGNTTYLAAEGGTASSQDKKIVGGAHHALVFTVHSDSVSEEIVLARHHVDVGGAARHFAVAELSPFLKKHRALTVVENLLILGVFCASLHNVIRVRKDQMVGSWYSC